MNIIPYALAIIAVTIISLLCCVIPGVHVYSIFAIIYAVMVATGLTSDLFPPTLTVAMAASILTSGALISTIPSLLLAPADDSAADLSALGSEALRCGRAPDAIIAAISSGATAILILIAPGIWVIQHITPVILDVISSNQHWILWCLVIYLLFGRSSTRSLHEDKPTKRFLACWTPILTGHLTLILSGLLGILLFHRFPAPSMQTGFLLLPLFAGLFSAPASIIECIHNRKFPSQSYSGNFPNKRELGRGVLKGLFAGSTASLFPAVSGGISRIFNTDSAEQGCRGTGVISQGSMRCTYFTGAFLLFCIPGMQIVRGGAAELLCGTVAPGSWPLQYAAISGAAIGCATALLFTPSLIHTSLNAMARMGTRGIHAASLALLSLIIISLTGPTGILIFLVATGIGLLPLLYGIPNTNLIAVMIIPMACRASGIQQAVLSLLQLT